MTKQELLDRIEEIRNVAHDDEVAHGSEDSLHRDVLQAIADGADNAATLARLALTTSDIEFCRWCA